MGISYIASINIFEQTLTPLTYNLRVNDEALSLPQYDLLSFWRAIANCDEVYTTPEAAKLVQARDSYSVNWLNLCGISAPRRSLLLADIDLSPVESLELHLRLRPFEEDWNAPGMEAYDEL